MKKILIIGSNTNSLINFRGNLINELLKLGHSVTAMAPNIDLSVIKKLKAIDVKFHSFPMNRFSLNPIDNIITFIFLFFKIKSIKPDIILAYTIKPVILTGLILFFYRSVKFYSLITGLGYVFQNSSFRRQLLKQFITLLYKFSLFRSNAVIFQNLESKNLFIEKNIINKNKSYVVDGSGVDLDWFSYNPINNNDPVSFLLIARLLKEKGIIEYFEAAKKVKKVYSKIFFYLLGPHEKSPDSISKQQFEKLLLEKNVKYLGSSNDVRSFIKNCHVYVLPSYHEGIPRTILEAMSMGRPILTTNVIGCKETVISGKNGFIVEKGNSDQLANKMIWFINNSKNCSEMGKYSRFLAEKRFDVKIINSNIISIMGL